MGGGVLAHLIVPVGNVFETLSVSDVVDDDDAVCVAVVAVGDGSKSLLAGSIPLGQGTSTSTNLAFSPLTVTVLVF